ncbi:DUF7490 domain-containing protein [Halosimplex sp. J119]
MNREAWLGALALLLVAAAAAVVVFAPGAVAERTDEDVRPSRLALQEPRVAAGDVGGEHAELSLDVRLDHRGGDAENVTVEVQAIDTDTGLVATTVRRDLGTVSGEREIRTRMNVTVERQGGYRLDIRVYEDGRRVETGSTRVSGVDSLTPDYAETSVGFERYGGQPTSPPVISAQVLAERNNLTTLRTATALTNRGSEPAGGLKLVVVARQVESNVVADRASVQVGDIGPGRTVNETVDLRVPSNYNYYLDGFLYRNGVLVETVTDSAMLDPSRPVPENTTREEVDFQAGDFAGTPEPGPGMEEDTPEPTPSSSGPGFGAVGALAALLATAALAARRNHD